MNDLRLQHLYEFTYGLLGIMFKYRANICRKSELKIFMKFGILDCEEYSVKDIRLGDI